MTPDFEGLYLDRMLDVNQHEIAGIRRAYRLPPVSNPGLSDIPYVYMLPRRESPLKIGGTSKQEFDLSFTMRLCGHSYETAKDETMTSGVKSVADLIPFIKLYRDYFFAHQGLQTAANPDAIKYLNNFTFTVDAIVAHGVDAANIDRFLIDFSLVFSLRWMC